MDTDQTTSRLDDLEEKTSFQEDTLQQLNDALVGHQTRIAHLEKTVHLLTEQLKSMSDTTDPEDDAPPPHY